MSLELRQILPNIDTGLSKIGFLFGAGTSKEAGYPLTIDLTKKVIDSLGSTERDLLEELLQKEEIAYDFEAGIPDIEVLSDIIYKNKTSDSSAAVKDLEQTIKNMVFQEFIPHSNINLEYHINFLRALKALTTNKAETIWIFTTNYDLLFEMAAMRAKIPIYNGFEGIIDRYFAPERLSLRYGTIAGHYFDEFKEPHIKILKLHGSISWYRNEEDICESYDANSAASRDYTMILPRQVKTLDALEYPYDTIFRYALQSLGRDCQYLVSCGYSFRDEHINDRIIIPKLRENRIRFTAFFKEAPSNLGKLRGFPNFNFVTESVSYMNGTETSRNCDTWKFSEFVRLFMEKAGIG